MIRRRKVLYVSRRPLWVDSRARRLVERLSREFDILVVAGAGATPEDWKHPANVRVVQVPLMLPHLSCLHLLGLVRILQLTWRALIEVPHSDIVVCADVAYAMPLVVAKLVFRKVTILDAHEIAWGMGDPWFVATSLRILEAIILRFCDLLVVPSEKRAELMLERHRLKVPYEVLLNLPVAAGDYPDSEITRASYRKERPTVLFLGTIGATVVRGLEVLIEASRDGAFEVVIQGSGPCLPRLRQIAHPFVRFVGPCLNHEVVRNFAQCDIAFVYYENDCINSAWACSNKFFAAVFAARPILCNRLPAFEQFANEYGGCVILDSVTPCGVRNALERLFEEPEVYQRLVAEMRSARELLLKQDDPARLLSRVNSLVTRSD
jgi:hypothetical protein